MTTLTVVFDGEALRPDGPVDLIPNRRYRVHLVPADDSGAEENESAWDVLERLEGSVEAPADWSVEHDHYLYGSQKVSKARPVGGSPVKA
jgi:hypothetical protein